MTKFTSKICHYFGETRDPKANDIKKLMAQAAPLIQKKGQVAPNDPFGIRKRYTYKGVSLIEDCMGEYVVKVPRDDNGSPDIKYLEAIINDSEVVHPIIIGCTIPPRV